MQETMVDAKVTYSLECNGKFILIEHVPARVCQETGAQFFAPETVERIQSLINGDNEPQRVVETPVYDYA